jgi:hypothetical protein
MQSRDFLLADASTQVPLPLSLKPSLELDPLLDVGLIPAPVLLQGVHGSRRHWNHRLPHDGLRGRAVRGQAHVSIIILL